jgi:hypothetical protein
MLQDTRALNALAGATGCEYIATGSPTRNGPWSGVELIAGTSISAITTNDAGPITGITGITFSQDKYIPGHITDITVSGPAIVFEMPLP